MYTHPLNGLWREIAFLVGNDRATAWLEMISYARSCHPASITVNSLCLFLPRIEANYKPSDSLIEQNYTSSSFKRESSSQDLHEFKYTDRFFTNVFIKSNRQINCVQTMFLYA